MTGRVALEEDQPTSLLRRWHQARAAGLNNRAAASKLGVSEAQLVASACGHFAARLTLDPAAILARLPELGEIKAIVRSPCAVLERAGVVSDVTAAAAGAIGVRADRFEMRAEATKWHSAFALREQSERGMKLSLQFFTRTGVSAAKFFLRPGGNAAGFNRVANAFQHTDQSSEQATETGPRTSYVPLVSLNATPEDGLLRFLEAGRTLGRPLTFVVRSPAATLSATKAIERVKRSDRGGWINVLDDGMDLHLHEARLTWFRAQREPDGNAGWVHWFAQERAVALSVRCADGWPSLIRSVGLTSP